MTNTLTAPPTTLVPQSAPPSRLPEIMEKSIAVVMLRMQGLPGHRKVPEAEVFVDGKKIEENVFSSPTLRLMPAKWATPFNKMLGHAQSLITNASPPRSETHDLPLPQGCYLIAGHRKGEITLAIQKLINEELVPLRTKFCDTWSEVVTEHRKQISSELTWQRMQAKIPTADQLRDAISLRFIVLPFTFLNEAGRAIAEEVAASIVAGISETMEEESNKLKEKLAAGQVLREGSFTVLKQQFNLLKDFSFLADPATLRELQQVEAAMAQQDLIEKVNYDVKRGGLGLATALSQAVNNLARELSKDSAGRPGRRRIVV